MHNNYTIDLENRNCIICGGDDFLIVSSRMRKGPQLTTVVCKACSLVFTNPIPSQEVYYSFYANDYEQYYGKSTASKPQASVRPVIFSTLEKFIDLKSSDYLEIGPGRGLTLYHAHKLFKSARGIEPSIDFTNILVNEFKLNVINNTFEEYMASAKEPVDVVSMFHVLEHIYDPCKGLMSIRDILREDGLVVIEVPNILKPFRNLDSYFLRFVHLYNFSPSSLKNLLAKCGFEIEFEDDGGDDWASPQNITIIARKSAFGKEKDTPFKSNASEVINILNQYRSVYESSLRFKWLLFDKTRTPVKYFRKVRHKLKVMLLSFLPFRKKANP